MNLITDHTEKKKLFIIPSLILTMGLIFSGLWYGTIKVDHDQQNSDRLKHLGQLVANDLQYIVNVSLDNIEALKAFYDGSKFVDANEFDTFSKTITSNDTSLASLVWIKHLKINPGASIQKSLQSLEVPLTSIDVRDTQNGRIPVADISNTYRELFPVVYHYGQSETPILGVDVNSVPEKSISLQTALQSGQPATTKILKSGNFQRLWVFSPVMEKLPHPGNILGFLGARLQLDHIQQKLVKNLGAHGQMLHIEITETRPVNGPVVKEASFEYFNKVDLPNKELFIRVKPSALFYKFDHSINPLSYFFVGLLITLMLAALSYLALKWYTSNAQSVKLAVELKQLNEELETLVDQRTIELKKQNKELEKTKIDLSQSNLELNNRIVQINETKRKLEESQNQLLQSQKMESLGRLAGGIAHDFNNFLAGIMGYASLLKSKLKNQPQLEKYAALIEKSSQTSATLTKQLLGFARKGNYEKRPFIVSEVISEVLPLVVRPINSSINVETKFINELWPIKGDSEQWHQVFLNLFVNAIDAMPGGGTLKISCNNCILSLDEMLLHKTNETECVQIIITDSGTGIPDDIVDKIFEPFYTTKGCGKGTGLGLSMVYGIIENHGGRIWVKSRPNQGTSFYIIIPRDKSSTGLSLPVISKTEVPSFESLSEYNILGVDDNTEVREVLSLILDELKIRNTFASNGDDFMRAYQESPYAYNLVLLDVIMPGMDGFEIYRLIQNINPMQKIVFISGYAQNDRMQEITQNPLVRFIHKPFAAHQIIATINSYQNHLPTNPEISTAVVS